MQPLFLHYLDVKKLSDLKLSGLSYLFCQLGADKGFICGASHIVDDLHYKTHFIVYLECVPSLFQDLRCNRIYTLCHVCVHDLPLDALEYNVWRLY